MGEGTTKDVASDILSPHFYYFLNYQFFNKEKCKKMEISKTNLQYYGVTLPLFKNSWEKKDTEALGYHRIVILCIRFWPKS